MPSNRKGHSVQVLNLPKGGYETYQQRNDRKKNLPWRMRFLGTYKTWQQVASQRNKTEAMQIARDYRYSGFEVRVLDPMRKVIAHYIKKG